MKSLWTDEAGFIISAELVIVATTVILGLTVGLVAVRDAIGSELADLAGAFRRLDQSYYLSGLRGCRKANGTYSSWTAGSFFFDPHLRTSGPQEENFPEMLDVGGFTVQGQRVAVATNVMEANPVPTPCQICPPMTTVAPYPVIEAGSAIETAPGTISSTVIPCLSCPPGTNGLLAPTPISVLPNHAVLPNYAVPVQGMGVIDGESGAFVPVYHPNRPVYNPYEPAPTGPLQVW